MDPNTPELVDSDREEEPTKIQDLKATIRGLNTTIQELNTTVTRLRASRDLHRTSHKDLAIKNQELKARIHALTVKEEKNEFLDSDAEEAEQSKKAAIPTLIRSDGNNKKYPDVPCFYGDKDQWDGWRMHL